MAHSVSDAEGGGKGRPGNEEGRRELLAALLLGRRRRFEEARPARADGPDPLEAGREDEEETVWLAVVDRSREARVQMDEALSRLAAGSYGLCADCTGPIPRARLRALPFALRCLRCQERKEGERSSRRPLQPTLTEGSAMMEDPAAQPDAEGPRCPFLEPARGDWLYPVAGYCRGLPQGALMIPTLFEHRTWCSTADHTACPIYQSKERQGGIKMAGPTYFGPAGPAVAVNERRAPAGAAPTLLVS
jgi:DnaK suppressor protein